MKKFILPFLLGMAVLKVAQNKTVQTTVIKGAKAIRDKVKSQFESLESQVEETPAEETPAEQPLPEKPLEE